MTSGAGSSSSSKKTADISAVVVLPGVHQDLVVPHRAMARLTTAALTNCGRAPTTVRTVRRRLTGCDASQVEHAIPRARKQSRTPRTSDAARLRVRRQLDAARAHPAGDAARVADDQRVVGHVAGDDGAGADERVPADRVTAQTMVQFAPSVAPRLTSVRRYSSLRDDVAPRVDDVGEHHRRPAEHVVLERRRRCRSTRCSGSSRCRRSTTPGDDDDVLADVAARADARRPVITWREVPDLRAVADRAAVVDVRRIGGRSKRWRTSSPGTEPGMRHRRDGAVTVGAAGSDAPARSTAARRRCRSRGPRASPGRPACGDR